MHEFPLTPVKAVPAKAHARGRRYHGETEMRYSARAMEPIDRNTFLHDLKLLISKA